MTSPSDLPYRPIYRYGWIPDLPDHRDAYRPDPGLAALADYPPVLSLRPQCPPVYDQGQLGACTGNALAGALQVERRKQGLPDFVPSRLFIYYNERAIEGTVGSDSGAMIRDGIKSLAAVGACPETDWPYDTSQFALQPPAQAYADGKLDLILQYARCDGSESAFKAALADGFPVVLGFSVYQSFESPAVAQTGLMPYPSTAEALLGGHAVLAVGWDDTKQLPGGITGALEVRNSWGPTWGDQGYFWMPWQVITNPDMSDDFWTIRLVES